MIPEKKNEGDDGVSRRSFLRNGALAAAGFMIVPRHVLGRGFVAPSDRLRVASVGVGGKGFSDITEFAKGPADINFLCDVDKRRAAEAVKNFPKAKFYTDWREMFDKEHKNFDAVSVSTPDHTHAVAAMGAMQLNKAVYVQKPMTHDIFEARMLTQTAKKNKVVTQMGNQGASGDGVRQLMEWHNAGLVGDVHTVYCWTDRPVWPQGVPWPAPQQNIPAELNWDLWLGTAPQADYVDNLLPFNWRGWWNYGTGAIGDMGCHIIEPPFRVLGLGYPTSVECSVGSVYVGEFKRGYFPESCPPSSHVIMKFPGKNGKEVTLHWMDGGIQPERPDELGPNEVMGDGGNGALFIGDKGKMMCGTYGVDPKLIPTSRTAQANVPKTIARVPEGHYQQWVNAAIAGYGSSKAKALSSPFDLAGPLTETILMANLAIRSFDIRKEREGKKGFDYPGRYIKLLWDGPNMKITNFDDANQFVKRTYRSGWSLGV